MSDYYPPPLWRVSHASTGLTRDARDVSPAQAALTAAAGWGKDGVYDVRLKQDRTRWHRITCRKAEHGWEAEYA